MNDFNEPLLLYKKGMGNWRGDCEKCGLYFPFCDFDKYLKES